MTNITQPVPLKAQPASPLSRNIKRWSSYPAHSLVARIDYHFFGFGGSEIWELLSFQCVILVCSSCGTTDWSIWHHLTVCMYACMGDFDFLFFYIHTCLCQCLCVSADEVDASPHCLFLGSAHNRTRLARRHLCMFSRGMSVFQNKHIAVCQPTKPQYAPYWQSSPASMKPLASLDRPSFSVWSSLTTACLLIGRSCKMSNYCSLGWQAVAC